MFKFEWDPAKAASNLRKHGISFELASMAFRDPLMRSIPDEHNGFEARWITIGQAREHLLVVSHTWNETAGGTMLVRIISARQATPKERRQYELAE